MTPLLHFAAEALVPPRPSPATLDVGALLRAMIPGAAADARTVEGEP